jgi:hypothetical protein
MRLYAGRKCNAGSTTSRSGQQQHLLDWLPSALGHDAIEVALVVHDLLSLDLNVYCLAAGPSQRLVDHDARVGHGITLALGSSPQQECSHRRSQPEAVSLYVRAAQLHARVRTLAASYLLDSQSQRW